MLAPRAPSLKYMLLAVSLFGAAASEPRVPTAASRNRIIFLTEVLSAQPGEGCAYFHLHRVGRCRTKVRARILRVFKGEYDGDALPAEFEVEIQQNILLSSIAPWTDIRIQAGQRYLILSTAGQIGPSAFASNLGPVVVTDREDTIGDLELILNSERLTLHQQASAVAAAIAAAGTPHSYFLANYAAGLLAAGSDSDTAGLARAFDVSNDQSFSDFARVMLLGDLWSQCKSAAQAPDNLLRTYMIMTARYFLLPSAEPTLELPSLREECLRTHIPWLLGSERSKSLMRTELPPTLGRRLRQQILALAVDQRQRPDRRQLMQELLALIGTN